MSGPLTVLKLGGALITDKQRPFTLRQSILDQAAAEIEACMAEGLISKLILVHGVGSFGHPPVVEHQLHKGFKSPSQLIHLTDTQNRVMHMRLAIAEAFHRAGLAVSTIFPSSCMVASGFALKTGWLEAVAGFLELGMTPLLGGDVLADELAGFCVYGGDKVAVDLAIQFDAVRLIFATEVDGIFDRDPHLYSEARPIAQFSLSRNRGAKAQLDAHRQVDASGAMAGKLDAVLLARDAITSGLRVHVLSMKRKGRLAGLLGGQQGIGTAIVP